MNVTLSARTYERGHFAFLPGNGIKITKNAKAKTRINGAHRTDGSYPRAIVAGDVLAFDENHALYAKKFYEVCKAAQECTSKAVNATITDDGLVLTYQDEGIRTRVTLYWSADIGASLHAGYELLFPYLDSDCKYKLFPALEPEPKTSRRNRHAAPRRPMLALDWLKSTNNAYYNCHA